MIQELHQRILLAPTPLYDPRLSEIMNEQAYLHYCHRNPGHTYYAYLAKLVHEMNPVKIVELGTDIGRASLFMMTQLQAGQLWTVELGTHKAIDLEPFVDDPRLHIVKGSTLDRNVIAKLGSQIDLLFVDADHTYASVSEEWSAYRELLSPGAVAVFDDIHLNSGMERFWSEITDPKVDTGDSLHFSGFGIVQLQA